MAVTRAIRFTLPSGKVFENLLLHVLWGGGAVLIGYARVSTSEQETRLQRDALRRAGVRQVFSEKGSSIGARP